MSPEDPFAPSPLERALAAERAGALRAAFAELERALAELRAAEAALAAAPGPAAALTARRDDRFAEAAERLWSVIVHREALGFVRHDDVLELLRVPRAVHLAMGPRRPARR